MQRSGTCYTHCYEKYLDKKEQTYDASYKEQTLGTESEENAPGGGT